jgi:hypothetical protein
LHTSKQISKLKGKASNKIKKVNSVVHNKKVLSSKDKNKEKEVDKIKKAVGGKFLKYQCRFCKKSFK